jgi:hypothetical protein
MTPSPLLKATPPAHGSLVRFMPIQRLRCNCWVRSPYNLTSSLALGLGIAGNRIFFDELDDLGRDILAADILDPLKSG